MQHTICLPAYSILCNAARWALRLMRVDCKSLQLDAMRQQVALIANPSFSGFGGHAICTWAQNKRAADLYMTAFVLCSPG
jgi:hypothetical protein